jgi:hypothetical protein
MADTTTKDGIKLFQRSVKPSFLDDIARVDEKIKRNSILTEGMIREQGELIFGTGAGE